jgi:cellulose synthase/poly-beta-1,6-N-acetylglucosamine synthase-like glycosyltransferase
MEWLFWGSLFLIAYPYGIYPPLVVVWAAVRPRPVRRAPIEPAVTVLVPAYNEAAVIAATLDAILAQDYPAAKLQIVVVSDASTDGTDAVVESYGTKRVTLLRQAQRGGKALGLNAGVRIARGEINVFCDANARFAPDAVRQLVRNFADPDVGYVTGKLTLESESPGGAASAGSAYLDFEGRLRTAETRIGSVIGVNGGCDAMRRELYSDV